MDGKPDGNIKAGDTTTATVVFQRLKTIPKVMLLSVALSSNFERFDADFKGVAVTGR